MSDTAGRPTPFRTIVEAAGDPMYTLDVDGCFDYVNEALVHQTAYSREELLGSPVSILLTDSAVERCLEAIQSLVSSDRDAETVEIQVTPGDGRRRNAEVTIALLPGEDGIEGTVGIVRDITDLRRSEQQLSVLERVLRHNLRNELTTILGRLEHLEDRVDDDTLLTHVEDMRGATDRIASLSEGVRDLRKSVHPETDLDSHDLVPLVESVVADQVAETPDATVTVECPESAPVRGTGAIRLVVDELVANALEHGGEEPTVLIETTVDGAETTLRVVDDGPGISDAERRAVTQRTESPLDHGTGLGLWLVVWVLESCGGSLSFECPPDGGTVAIAQFQSA